MDNQPECIEELYPDLIARLIEFAGEPEFPEDEGSSGRFNRLDEVAIAYAFALQLVGLGGTMRV